VLSGPPVAIPASHLEALTGAAAVGAVFAELFMIKSLLIFDPKSSWRSWGRSSSDVPSSWNVDLVRQRIHPVLFGIQNRTLDPYWAAMPRVFISAKSDLLSFRQAFH
jgi:hypothetical protein